MIVFFFRSSIILSDGVFRIIEVAAAAAAAAATPFKDSSEWRSMKRVRLGRRARADTGVFIVDVWCVRTSHVFKYSRSFRPPAVALSAGPFNRTDHQTDIATACSV